MNSESPKNEIHGTYREYTQYLTMGFQLAAAVVVFFFLGDWIDKHYGIEPVGKLVGMSIGMVGGFVKFFKSVASMIKDEEQKELNKKREN
jgi:F0F1-type ATP synthase assembly protein I